jgi:RNA polymerase sigma-70 factor, ECF subfamily
MSTMALPRIDRDGDLLAALQRRDWMAPECLISRFGNRAYRLAVRITGNGQDAEEAAQDAFWNVVRSIDSFRGESSFGSWIYRIVANAAYHKLRVRARRSGELLLDEALPGFDDDGWSAGPVRDWSAQLRDPAVESELRDALETAIGELPSHYRAIVELHEVEGIPMDEVASALGVSVSAAKSRAHRARQLLRGRLAMLLEGQEDGAHEEGDELVAASSEARRARSEPSFV